jgi:magnesium chelatase family protein
LPTVLAVARTFALLGIEAERVHVELDVAGGGLPSFSIVGLPDTAVRESRERVRSALVNSDFNFPQHRITANLAPADLPKVGPGFDLAIAAALLTASHQLPQRALDRYALAGELALDGSIRPVPGALAMAEGVRGWGMRGIAVASEDAALAAMADGVEVVPIDHIKRLRDLAGDGVEPASPPDRSGFDPGANGHPDLSELRGQPGLRYAIEISAAGGHSALLIGPPGAGKTLAARMLPSLLPPLGHAESLEVTRIMSACGERPTAAAATRRPFRAPHHTASGPALVGGGMPPRPGEVTRAHRGVLFLDELGEFRRDALEALRQPLEEGGITVARANRTISLPCRFTLVGASNPCPCGRGANSGDCDCHPTAVARYRAKLSGALADRIDILVFVDRPPADAMSSGPGETSGEVRERVLAARARQEERLGAGRCNAEMTPGEIRRHCRLGAEAERLLADGHERLGLSGRGWDRVVRVARTVADLKGLDEVGEDEIGQALSLRRRTDDDLGA